MHKRPTAAMAELRPLRAATPPTADAPAFTLSRSELEALIVDATRHAVEAALAATPARASSANLLSVSEMAERLGCHRSKVNSMRLQGCPAVRLGSIFRYEPAAVLAWLKAQEPRP
jgi:excisionase family DNA binding protein